MAHTFEVFRNEIANLKSINKLKCPDYSMNFGVFIFVHNPLHTQDSTTGILYFMGAFASIQLAKSYISEVSHNIGFDEIHIIHFGKPYPIKCGENGYSTIPQEILNIDVKNETSYYEDKIYETRKNEFLKHQEERARYIKEEDINSIEFLNKKIENLEKVKQKIKKYNQQYEALVEQINNHPQLPFTQFNPK